MQRETDNEMGGLLRFDDKRELRKYVRSLKGRYSARELEELSVAVVERLLAHPRIVAAGSVMMYYSLPDEVCTHTAVDRLLSAGKRVYLPAVTSETEMELRCYESAADLQEGSFKIKEPVGRPFTAFSEIEIAVIPGMAFDVSGNRLGRGKGYYDRFLNRIPQAYRLGVCFPFQLLPSIPAEENDVRMDEVLC